MAASGTSNGGSAQKRVSILERAKENAEETVLRERSQREKVAAENAELRAELESIRTRYGLDELMNRSASESTARMTPRSGDRRSAHAGAEADVSSGSGRVVTATSWSGLLQDTKAMQTRLEHQDRARRDALAEYRLAGATLAPDPESARQFNQVLDSLLPQAGGGQARGLAHLIAVEDRLAEVKSQRSALEEHLAYLNRIHSERSAADEQNFTAASLLSQRLWKLEEHAAMLREAVVVGGAYGRGVYPSPTRGTNTPGAARSERSMSVASGLSGVEPGDWLDMSSDSLHAPASPIPRTSAPPHFVF